MVRATICVFSTHQVAPLQESAQAYSPAHKVYSDVYEQLDDASIVKLTQLVDLQDSRNTSTQLSIRSDSLELSQHDDPLARLHRYKHDLKDECLAFACIR
jgi:hypothetical protein